MERTRGNSIKYKVRAENNKLRAEKVHKTAEAKQKVREEYSKKYNKLKFWRPSKNTSMNLFCSFYNEIFCNISLPALAVYPVLCADADFKNQEWKQLSLENIRKKTGLSIPTIQKGIEELCNTTIFDKKTMLLQRKKHTDKQRTFWLYKPWFIHEDEIKAFKGEQFFFYTYIIESGLWSKLSPRAKALYLAMRSFSIFDFQTYCDVEGILPEDFNGEKANHQKWGICKISLADLCQMIRMSYSHIYLVTNQLMQYNLIDEIEDGYIVYQLPADVYVEN